MLIELDDNDCDNNYDNYHNYDDNNNNDDDKNAYLLINIISTLWLLIEVGDNNYDDNNSENYHNYDDATNVLLFKIFTAFY